MAKKREVSGTREHGTEVTQSKSGKERISDTQAHCETWAVRQDRWCHGRYLFREFDIGCL